MNKRKKTVAAVVGILVCAGTATAYYQGQLQSPVDHVYFSEVTLYSSPVGVTVSDLVALTDATRNGDPLPPGFAMTDHSGRVDATLSKVASWPTMEKQLICTVVDDILDLETAELYVNGSLVFTATRSSGAIVDRSPKAIATLSAFVQPDNTPFEVELRWVAQDGRKQLRSHTRE